MNSHLRWKRRTLFFASTRAQGPNHHAQVVGIGSVYKCDYVAVHLNLF
jgi:hypothetical protein